jgi:pimeloyl-ACP methyl ester carboxylesterase
LFQSGWTLWAAIGVPLLLAIAWRALLVVAGFAVAGVWRRPAAGNWRTRLGAWAGEFWAQLRLYTWIQPLLALERWPPSRTDAVHPPVVLVHGFMCNAGVWSGFARALRKRGIDGIFALNLDPLYRDMPASLALFQHKLERILRRCNAQSAVLVGHSMGGVLVRLYRNQHPQQVAAACAIGAPHHGTLGARLIGGGRERGPPSPSSLWLQRYNHECPSDAGLLNIWSESDNIVWPQDSAHLETALELKVNGFGHLHLLDSQQVRDAVVQLIQDSAVKPAVSD